MSFPKLDKDLAIISKLGDNPNIDDGLSAEALKAKFDEAAQILQKFLNEDLIAELDRLFAGGDSVPVDGLNMNGPINMNEWPLQNVRDPSSEHEAVNLRYALANFLSAARSINGYTLDKDIVLTAEDVGARSKTWLPTPAEIGVRNLVATDPNNDGNVILKYSNSAIGGGGSGEGGGSTGGGLTAEQVQDMINDALSKLPTAEELPSAEEVSF